VIAIRAQSSGTLTSTPRETGSLPLAQARVLIDLLHEEPGSGSCWFCMADDDDEGEYEEEQRAAERSSGR
jgi:hypothetical protein